MRRADSPRPSLLTRASRRTSCRRSTRARSSTCRRRCRGCRIAEAGWILQQMDKKLKAFPEVERVFGKIGRADTSTDPAPLDDDRDDGARSSRSRSGAPGMTKDKLVAEMDKAMQIVGYVNSWVQPIRARVMMQNTGIQTPVGIKVKGPDLAVDRGDRRSRSRRCCADFPGTQVGHRRAHLARATTSTCRIDLERMAEHGVTVDEAMPTVRLRHRRRQHRRHQAGRQDASCR